MDPVRELPYWPAAMALLIEAGQMTASDYVPTYPDLMLASNGASTDAIPESTQLQTFAFSSETYSGGATFGTTSGLRKPDSISGI
jgi:hypothetical protein